MSLSPSRPLGPITQAFTLPPSQRVTPVVLPFADRDELTLEVTFPEGWRVEVLPAAAEVKNEAGALHATAAVDTARRVVRYERRLEITARESGGREAYARLQALFAAAEKQDAQALALARRSLPLLLGAPAAAAVCAQNSVTLEVRADGSLRERWRGGLVQSAEDLQRWSPSRSSLDENRRLVRLEGRARLPTAG